MCGFLTLPQAYSLPITQEDELNVQRQVFSFDFLQRCVIKHASKITLREIAQLLHVYTPDKKSIFRYLPHDIVFYRFLRTLNRCDQMAHTMHCKRFQTEEEWLDDLTCFVYYDAKILLKKLSKKRKLLIKRLLSHVSYSLISFLFPEKEKVLDTCKIQEKSGKKRKKSFHKLFQRCQTHLKKKKSLVYDNFNQLNTYQTATLSPFHRFLPQLLENPTNPYLLFSTLSKCHVLQKSH
jgi:hypothetical protein